MQDIKRRMKSVGSIKHITNAMKLVSAAKLKKAKNAFEKTGKYFHYVTDVIEEIFHNTDDVPLKYLEGNREIKSTGYVVVTSCRGLCGGFNSNVIREAEREIAEDPERPKIIAVGGKGKDYFKKRGYDIRGEYMLPPENISFLETRAVSGPLIGMYDAGEIDEAVLIYTSFVNSFEQRVKSLRLLPFEIRRDPERPSLKKQMEYEPSAKDVFNYLVPKYVEIMIYSAIVESAVCEHAARRIAMESATDNANSMISSLNLSYNRIRQSAITGEIMEIVSGAGALK
ncbi:MAG: ATP synthase F1 subunit gamma [Clostridiales Family XIII bacterium]|jgi:F-type H+-transporting ATPase subunit gamma|nr:ATP synthase F1 subunit gamma [Clostridiales Family XIII bacterium]